MANNLLQNINKVLFGNGGVRQEFVKSPYSVDPRNQVLYSTSNKEAYEAKLEQYRTQKLLSREWVKAGNDIAMENISDYTPVKLMYRDADLMCSEPEIGSAIEIMADEACTMTSKGKMVNVTSKSPRIKAILEDLFVNRLNIHVDLPMIAHHMCKYGNTFMLLNVDVQNGIMGWRKLPVYEIDRIENGIGAMYGAANALLNTNELKTDDTKFVWAGHNDGNAYEQWQVAHFRMLNDSFFLPYGVSVLHKARRAWRMWSMMEDAMLIYRLDKSIERRVFKIYVGGINDADVPAYVNDIANNFKRTQLIDPNTGQVDLRKNFLDVSGDYFIPVRTESAPNPIESVPSANNPTSMDDINYMQNKVFAALRVPKTFLNFQEAQGKGQNLSLMDIRFARMVNRIQQYILMELNKIAMIHLYLIGLKDEVSNFSLSMNTPSSQLETLELQNLQTRVSVASAALADPGIGFPLMSYHRVCREIFHMSDPEIKDMLCEIRVEKAMGAEYANTANIIKKTGIFDSVDNIYGDYEAMNNPQQGGAPQEGEDGGMGGGMGGGASMGGGDILGDLGEPGGDESGDISGSEGMTDMGSAPQADSGALMESFRMGKPLLRENVKKELKTFTQRYFDMLSESAIKNKELNEDLDTIDFEGKMFHVNNKLNSLMEHVETIINKHDLNIDELDAIDEETLVDDDLNISDLGEDYN